MPKLLTNPYLLLTLTALFWSGNMVLGRAIRNDAPPIALAFWRWAIAFALTLPLAWPHRAQLPLVIKAWKPVIGLGVVGIGLYNTFAYISLTYTAATNAILLNAFIPVATIALSWAFLGKRLSRLEALGVLVSFLGVALIVARGDLANLSALVLNRGDLWMLGAVLSWAIYTVGLQWRPTGIDPMLLLAAMIAVGWLALFPAYAWEISTGKSIHLSLPVLAGVAYTGIFPGFLGYICYNCGVALVGPSRASLFLHLMPVFGIILSAVLLGERPQLFHFVAIALIFAGIFLTTRYRHPG